MATTSTPTPKRRTEAAIAARKQKAAERRQAAGMLVLVSKDTDGVLFERRQGLSLEEIADLKAKGHQIITAAGAAWHLW